MSSILRAELLALMRGEPHGVVASTSDAGAPQAALVGLAVSDAFEIVFDTLGSTRKAANLRARPHVAVVLGSVDAGSQSRCSSRASPTIRAAPISSAPARLLRALPRRPDAPRVAGHHPRARAVDVAAPSDYRADPPRIVELDAAALAALK